MEKDILILLEEISNHIRLNPAEIDLVKGAFHLQKLKKKEFLIKEGEIIKGLVFVTQGILRSFALGENGMEHVIQFAPSRWWIVDMFSLVKQKPSRLSIEALENSQILQISKPDLDKLYRDIPKLERFFRILAENSLINYQSRLINNLSLTALKRYEHFCEQYPELIQCLAQKYIASYIGVSPEFFSKMMNSIAPKR